MKRIVLAGMILLGAICRVHAQTSDDALQKADAAYKQFNEADALAAYKQVLVSDPGNVTALVRAGELSSSMGEKQGDKNRKVYYFEQTKIFADQAMSENPKSADAYYLQALAYANLSKVESENKKTVEDVKKIKLYADSGLAINPNYARLNYMEGKWHLEMVDLNWFKKAALKTFYNEGLAKPDIDSAIFYMEKCKTLEPYFVQNYVDLAKAYKIKGKPTDEIAVLNKLIKLPNRMAGDAELKERGKKRLQELQ